MQIWLPMNWTGAVRMDHGLAALGPIRWMLGVLGALDSTWVSASVFRPGAVSVRWLQADMDGVECQAADGYGCSQPALWAIGASMGLPGMPGEGFGWRVPVPNRAPQPAMQAVG